MAKIAFKNIARHTSSDENDLTDLLSELDELIPKFTESSIFQRDIFSESDENHYTETLIKYFENEKSNSRFSYKQQASLPNRRSIDIGIHLKTDSEHYIFCIEAKFLPPKDYVTGEYAAIKRFKKQEHGLSCRNPEKARKLLKSAIIGYSKSNTNSDHLKKINNKINALAREKGKDKFGLSWSDEEKLQVNTLSPIAILYSSHQRSDNSYIKLYHFWISV